MKVNVAVQERMLLVGLLLYSAERSTW